LTIPGEVGEVGESTPPPLALLEGYASPLAFAPGSLAAPVPLAVAFAFALEAACAEGPPEEVTELELIPAPEEELEFGAEAWDEEAATTPGGAHPSTNARAELGIVICAPREELTCYEYEYGNHQ
jgi:hypothetical protein